MHDFELLILGGTGQVGLAIARKFAKEGTRKIAITGLRKEEVESAIELLKKDFPEVDLQGEYGNVFARESSKDKPWESILEEVIEDALVEFNERVLEASFLYRIVERYRPRIIVDTINTATALAYQDIFTVSRKILSKESITKEDVYKLTASASIPLLVRHIQILWETMVRFGTKVYIKVGTTGTGGMGLNIPYTHGEERPSRVLLSKSALAGAHTMLLFLASRTPSFSILNSKALSRPIVKEIKPAALIAWKDIGFGRISKRGKSIKLYDETEPVKLEGTFNVDEYERGKFTGKYLEDVYIDTGENGVFSLHEFKAITSLNQMEFITPEEIADAVFLEAYGDITSSEVLSALGGATMKPTYRGAYLRQRALRILEEYLERYKGRSWAFEILGPPRLSKLILEAQMLKEIYTYVENVLEENDEDMVSACRKFVMENATFRMYALSIGIPIFMEPNELIFARRDIKDKQWEGVWNVSEKLEYFRHNEWIDISKKNMQAWKQRMRNILQEANLKDTTSQTDRNVYTWRKHEGKLIIDPGEFTAWVFEKEDRGYRFKIG